MDNGDFELAGYLIGRNQPVFASSFTPGPMGDREQDALDPTGDMRMFGRDRRTPPSWEFEFNIAQAAGQAPAAGALASLEQLHRTWRTAVDTNIPGEFTSLRYQIGGRVRRVYGRPRNFVYDPSKNLEDGHITATADFALLDTFTYQDVQESIQLQLRTPPNGSVTLPAVWPLISIATGGRQGVATIGGAAPTLVDDVTFFGPVVNPSLSNGSWSVNLTASIPYDGWIRVDPRRRTVMRHDGASVPGTLSRKTRMRDLVLTPGGQAFNFTGQDDTANARAVVRWRPAYYSL